MGKAAPDATLDAYLTHIAQADQQLLCDGEPANRTAALSQSRAAYPLTPGAGNGDFTIGDSATSGRRLTVAEKGPTQATSTGNVDHVALINATDLLLVTTMPSQTLTSGRDVTAASWGAEIADPV